MIPLVDLKAQYRQIKLEIDAAISRILERGQFVLGEEVTAFEEEFAAYCGVRDAIGVNSGTSALHLALLAAGIGPQDEVITVPFTFVATVSAILYCGARPVLVDIEPRSLTLDARRLEAAITPRTQAIIPVHLYGQPADLDPILALARRHGLVVIEDAAQAHGALYQGRGVGGIGDMGCFSFYPSKNLGAYGEGGAVTTNEPRLARRIRLLRDWGAKQKYQHDLNGYNYRLKVRFWGFAALMFFLLSLGPFLHLQGRSLFKLDDIWVMVPLPGLLLHFLPIAKGVMVPSRYDLMLMLSLAVLVGYTLQALLRWQARAGWPPRASGAFIGLMAAVILVDFMSVPLPTAEARMPRICEAIGQTGRNGGSLIEVPLDPKIAKYHFYQVAHRKKLLTGYLDHPTPSLVGFADAIPFIRLFQEPRRIAEYEQSPVHQRDVWRLLEFFDVEFIVLHRDYPGPEIFDRLLRFLLTHFPIRHVEREGDLAALQLARDPGKADWWGEEGSYLVDFGSTVPQFSVTRGWSHPERWGDLTVGWSNAGQSRLWVFFLRRQI